MNSPMQHFMWSHACAETFGSAGTPHFVMVGSEERPTALAPLIRRKRIFSRLEMIGVKELYEPMDFHYSDHGSPIFWPGTSSNNESPSCYGECPPIRRRYLQFSALSEDAESCISCPCILVPTLNSTPAGWNPKVASTPAGALISDAHSATPASSARSVTRCCRLGPKKRVRCSKRPIR